MATVTVPLQQTITAQQSLTIMRNTVRTAVSSIAYLRNLYEEDAFEDKDIGGLNLKILRPNCPETKAVLVWMEEGVFDALEKQYLRLLSLGIHDSNDDLLESYRIHFSYGTGKNSVTVESSRFGASQDVLPSQNFCTPDNAKDQTISLLRSLIMLTQNLEPLPDVRYVSIKMWYYDDAVPTTYQPAHFSAADSFEVRKFRDVPQECVIGAVATGHHDLSIDMKTTVQEEDSEGVGIHLTKVESRDETNISDQIPGGPQIPKTSHIKIAVEPEPRKPRNSKITVKPEFDPQKCQKTAKKKSRLSPRRKSK